MRINKKITVVVALLVFGLILNSCTSSRVKQIQELQETQKQLSDQASENLANIDSLQTKVAKYRLKAKDLQKQSDALASDIDDLNKAYSNFNDPNNDSAIAVNKELTQKTLQKVKLDQKINQYRTQANGYQSQIDDLRTTSQEQANQAAKISEKINQLKSHA